MMSTDSKKDGTNKTTSETEEDDLEELLAQADSMISSAASSGGGGGDAGPSYVVEGFSIDSDEEEGGGGGDDDDDEGVQDVSLDSPEPAKSTHTVTSNVTLDPLKPPPPTPPVQPTKEADPLLHPLHEDVVGTADNPAPDGTGTAVNNNSPTTQTQAQTQTQTQATSHAHFPNAVTTAFQNFAVSEYEQQFKAQTSKFASNLANMAQRVVASAASGTPTSGSGMMNGTNSNGSSAAASSAAAAAGFNSNDPHYQNYPQPMSVSTATTKNARQLQTQSSSHSSPAGSTHGGGGGVATATPTNTNVPAMPSNFELDNDQKTALVEMHVGKLLPGERVIMFLSNLMHVSDSSGFSYASNAGPPGTIWCCAMTYYRLILFGATHESMLYIMNHNGNNNNSESITTEEAPPVLQHNFCPPAVWNASCWPPAHPTVMEMPLATMERVEKTVYTPTASSPQARVTTLMGLQVWAKEGRYWRITTPSYADTTRAHQALLTYAFPGRRNLGYLFAFESKRADVVNSVVTDPTTGQKTVTLALTRKRFDAIAEFQRQLYRYHHHHQQAAANGGDPASAVSQPTSPPPPQQPQPWKIYSQLNGQYQLCMSYPNVLVGPASLDDQHPDAVRLLQNCAAFRSEQRLPSLTWASGMDGASLWRASQPKIGLQGNRSSADELVLKHIMEAAKSANALREQPLPVRMDANLLQVFTGVTDLANSHWVKEAGCALKILDLRPRSAAMANRTGGYGYENTSNYPGTTLQFCNIGNIHAVRDSYQKMTALCLNTSNASEVNWGAALEDTKWLSHIRLILAAAWEAAFWVYVHRMPVLIHCSHGWDRTAQVSALSQLMLDPYYRTMEGFACLVEKDFMSFGHPFHTRCAHGEGKGGTEGGGVHHQDGANGAGGLSSSGGNSSAADEGQISPIFLQFLDCVWQLVNQYPECFEFTAGYLLELSNHIYSCRFGNMLCDTERERELVAGIRQRTYSLWDHLDQDPNDSSSDKNASKWKNKSYDPSPQAGGGVLLMPLPTLLRSVSLWAERHAQYGPKPTQRWRNSVQARLISQAAPDTSTYTIN